MRFRSDIEGLRGVAVALVLAFHLTAFPAGGFVGVDVFFVISGFLITALLLREHRGRGRISLLAFYGRRARRILPAAVVVVLATVVAATIVWFPPRALAVLEDAFAAITFAENWRMLHVGQSYSAAAGASPLEHFWSLAVEEQFYAVWPIVVIVLVAAAGLGRGRPWVPAAGVTLVVVLSLVGAVVIGTRGPTGAYVNPVSRMWEPGAGALVAMVPRRLLGCVPGRLRPAVSIVGAVLIAGSACVAHLDDGFPWPGSLVPVVGAALLVVEWPARPVLPAADPVRAVLASAPLRWLGSISYPLYLWHLPVIAVTLALCGGTPGPAPAVMALAVSVALAVATRRWIELPILRRSRAQRARRTRRRRWQGYQATGPRGGRLGTALLALVAVAVMSTSSLVAYRSAPLAPVLDAVRARIEPLPDTGSVAEAGRSSRRSALTAALESPDWAPTALRELAHRPESLRPAAMTGPDRCLAPLSRPLTTPAPCRWGPDDAEHVAVVVGDSVAMAWTPAIAGALVPEGWRVEALGFAACPMAELDIGSAARSAWWPAACADGREAMRDLIREIHPDLLVMSVATGYEERLRSGATGAAADTEREEALAVTITELAPSVGSTTVLQGPPRGALLTDCAVRWGGPSRCETPVSSGFLRDELADRAAVDRVASAGVTARYLRTAAWFCVDRRCPATVDGRLVKADDVHLTAHTSASLAGLVRDALEPALSPGGTGRGARG